jgi:hypothetical protein
LKTDPRYVDLQHSAADFLLTKDIAPRLEKAGIALTPGSAYLSWFQGPGGAVKTYTAPDNATVAQVFPRTVAANSNMRFNGKSYANWTMSDLRQWADTKMAQRMQPARQPLRFGPVEGYEEGGRVGYANEGAVRDPDDPRRVVLSAHLDGHPLAQSAMDNASGLAVALALARAVAPQMHQAALGLRVCLFTAEEWALAGSRQWLAMMAPAERSRLVIDINLDTVGADPRLTALTSGFAGLDAFVAASARAAGQPIGLHRPLMPNSDHANFAAHGIPALRLIAGFDQPASRVRHILTAQDTRDQVAPAELAGAARASASLLWRALCATDADVSSWR